MSRLLTSAQWNLVSVLFSEKMKPALPPVSSWYPGHMATFARTLPSTLKSTHVVLEARDARMPLSSINTAFEDEIKQWQKECGGAPAERIVVYTKSDLVPEWGMKVCVRIWA